MDMWIVAFAILIIVSLVLGFVLGQNLSPRKRPVSSGIPSDSKYDFDVPFSQDMGAYAPSDPWEDIQVEYEPPSVKGFKIAWKQFIAELDTYLSDLSSASEITGYHSRKYDELNSFFISSQSSDSNVVSPADIDLVRKKLEKAKQKLTGF